MTDRPRITYGGTAKHTDIGQVIDQTRKAHAATGLSLKFKCPVCGMSKRDSKHNGDKCSKIMQQRGFDK